DPVSAALRCGKDGRDDRCDSEECSPDQRENLRSLPDFSSKRRPAAEGDRKKDCADEPHRSSFHWPRPEVNDQVWIDKEQGTRHKVDFREKEEEEPRFSTEFNRALGRHDRVKLRGHYEPRTAAFGNNLFLHICQDCFGKRDASASFCNRSFRN